MSLGKKITCPFCKTKLFSFNKTNLPCPICKKKIIVEKNYEDYHEEKEQDSLEDLTDDELINKVIPQHFYDIIDILNSLDEESNDLPEKHEEDQEDKD